VSYLPPPKHKKPNYGLSTFPLLGGGYDYIWDESNEAIAKGKFCKQKQGTYH